MSIIPGSDSGFGGGGGGGGSAPDGAVLYDAAQALSAAQAKQGRDNIGAMTLLSFANVAAFPVTGAGQTIYQASDTGLKYLWAGAAYVDFVPAVTGLVTGPAHIIPEVTSDNEANGAAFLAAYAAAAALTPGGAPLSATNRACVLLLPGTYDWTATELPFVPSDNVDIAGISGNRDDVQLVGAWATGITCNYNASNVTGGFGAFHIEGTLTGVFRNCKGGDYSFAANDTFGSTFSGTATDCVGGTYSFGGGAGTFSGTATGCTGGEGCFTGEGGFFVGTPRITSCVAGASSFGASAAFPVDFTSADSVLVKDCRLTDGAFTNLNAKYKVRSCINADLTEANYN